METLIAKLLDAARALGDDLAAYPNGKAKNALMATVLDQVKHKVTFPSKLEELKTLEREAASNG